MSARDTILASIRASLGAVPEDDIRRQAARNRLAEAPRGVIPDRAQLPDAERLALFVGKAEAVNATVETAGSYEELAPRVAAYLRERNLPLSVRIGADPKLALLAEDRALEVKYGLSDGADLAGVSHALSGIAETGTLVLTAGPDNPTTINFLTEYHIVVVDARDIVPDLETAWTGLREVYGKGRLSRVVNFVTGPSRSADIEQTLLLGAHGPRALHIIVIDQTETA